MDASFRCISEFIIVKEKGYLSNVDIGTLSVKRDSKRMDNEFVERAYKELDWIRDAGIKGKHGLYINNQDSGEYSYANSLVSILNDMLGFKDYAKEQSELIIKHTFTENHFSLVPENNKINLPSTLMGMILLHKYEQYRDLNKCMKLKIYEDNNGFLLSGIDKNISSVFFTALNGLLQIQMSNLKKADEILNIIEKRAKVGKHGLHLAYIDNGPELAEIGLAISILKVAKYGYNESEEYINSAISLSRADVSTHALTGILFALASGYKL